MSFIGNFFKRFGRYEKEINNSENKYVTETENVFPASLLRSHSQTKKKKSFILNGTYGAVFRNYSNPKKVIKVYKHKTNTNKEHDKANTVFKITKNNRQKVQIVQDLQYNDLPNNIKNKFSGLNHTNPISAIRMNDLGVDLYTCITTQENFDRLIEIPVPILLLEFYKLIWQINQLNEHHMCHRDIKLDNIMIDLETGTMTLIDFDLLHPFDETIIEIAFILAEYIEKGTPFTEKIPPEWLIIGNAILQKAAKSSSELMQLYSSPTIMAYYGAAYSISNNTQCKENHVRNISSIIKENTPKLMKAINEIFDMFETNNIPYKSNIPNNGSISIDHLMSKFDIFGLGGVFCYVLSKLIPNLREKDPNNHLFSAFKLAKKMYEYDITKRVTPAKALAEMTGILNDAGISLPVFGGRRQTRRR